MSGVQGCIETLSREFVGGWVVDADNPDKSVTVELLQDGLPVARAIADRPRPDLANFNAEKQNYGFALPLPPGTLVDQERIAVRVVGTQTLLQRWEGAPTFEGRVERVTERAIFGWAWHVGLPRDRVTILIRYAGVAIGRLRADKFRPDLLDAGVGDGHCSFQFELDPGGPIQRIDPELLDVVFDKTGAELVWIHPRARKPAPPPAPAAPEPVQAAPQPAPVAPPPPAKVAPATARAAKPVPAAAPAPAPRQRPAAPRSRIKISPELLESMRGSVSFGDDDLF